MRYSTSDVVRQPVLDRVLCYPFFDPDAELFPEITTLASTSIGTIPDNNRNQSVTTLWRTSTTGQYPFREPSAPNELTVSYWSEMYEDDLVTEHYPAFVASTMPQIELLEIEVSHNKTLPVDCSLRFFSRLCVINQEFPRSPAQSHPEGSKKVPQNLCRK
jgi:hypothetical protein